MQTVLVTGGAGYVGSHACKALAQSGFKPVVYDDLSRGHDWAVKWGPLERGDIRDADRLTDVCRRHRPVAVLHFAGLAYVHESVLDPVRYFEINVQGTASVLRAMRAGDVPQIVLSSSCTTYGVPQSLPLSEDAPQRPISPYGWSKLAAEQLIRAAGRAHGIRFALLRYFNAAGADPDGEIGEDHDPETHLVPNTVNAALPDGAELQVFGNDYDTEDGTCVRDYVHVTDLADAHVRALHALGSGRPDLVLNVGTGLGHSVLEVIQAVQRAAARPVRYVFKDRREGDPPRLFADHRRIVDALGWTPQHSSLDSIATTAWRWATGSRR